MSDNGKAAIVAVTSFVLLAAVRSDIKKEKISNRLILFGLAAGIGLHLCVPYAGTWLDTAAGMGLPFVICWLLFRIRALGAGDIKLFMLIGCLNGFRITGVSMAGSFLVAAAYALAYLICTGQLIAAFMDLLDYARLLIAERKPVIYSGRYQRGRQMHFAPAVLAGYLLAIAGVENWVLIS